MQARVPYSPWRLRHAMDLRLGALGLVIKALPDPTGERPPSAASSITSSVSQKQIAEFFALLGGGVKEPGWVNTQLAKARLAIVPGYSHYNFITSPEVPQIVAKFLADPLTNPPSGAAAASQASPAPEKTQQVQCSTTGSDIGAFTRRMPGRFLGDDADLRQDRDSGYDIRESACACSPPGSVSCETRFQ
jgi:hypothetical protein